MTGRADKVHTRREGRRLITALVFVLLLGCFCPAFAAEGYDQVATSGDMAASKEVKSYGMVPIRAADVNEGNYKIEVRSSSTFFRIEKAVLKVKDGKMTADITLYSTSYKFVYPGTAQEAAAAPLEEYTELKERSGQGSFEMEVSGLNEEISCAAFSKKKKKWYDRTILFEAGSLPKEALAIQVPDYDKIDQAVEAYENGEGAGSGNASSGADAKAGADSGEGALASYDPVPLNMEDGEYSIQVNMAGGSGRASVSSPTWLIVKDGKAWARLLWSSTYYDYMIVGGEKYLNETKDGGNSSFTIPIAVMDDPMPVIADTTAMGDPVEIEYELTFYQDSIGSKSQIPQEAATNVLILALIIIVIGGILNIVIKKRRKQ
ncbi:MAG: hypothetical protein IJ109_07285 [Firmicutes bacterium]|nr:hypothetical protein [Bacillota bacterium]